MLGGTALGHHYYQFLLVHTLFLVFTRIPGIFINTLLMNQTGSINSTLFYNGAIFAACAVHDDSYLSLDHALVHKSKVTAANRYSGIITFCIFAISFFRIRWDSITCLFGLANGMADGILLHQLMGRD